MVNSYSLFLMAIASASVQTEVFMMLFSLQPIICLEYASVMIAR